MEATQSVVVVNPIPEPLVVRPLTRRERQIIGQVVEGFGNDEIAMQLGVSPQTIKNQLTVIFSKLHVRTRVQLAVYALRNGMAQ
jgi:DNA-binding NarL/FixJ family response regulator